MLKKFMKQAADLITERTADGEPLWYDGQHRLFASNSNLSVTPYLFRCDQRLLRREFAKEQPWEEDIYFFRTVARLLMQQSPDRGAPLPYPPRWLVGMEIKKRRAQTAALRAAYRKSIGKGKT